jgi:citrate/tricarballylate utilization protein
MKIKSHGTPAGSEAYSIDYTFLVALGLTALTGILTLIFRDTAALGSLLVLHLVVTTSLFITAPYGSFVHFLYRTVSASNTKWRNTRVRTAALEAAHNQTRTKA